MKCKSQGKKISINKYGVALLLLTVLLTQFFAATALASSHPFLPSHGVVFSSGNKQLSETDFRFSSPVYQLSFRRYYNRQETKSGVFGYGWSTGIAHFSNLEIYSSSIILVEASGRRVIFTQQETNLWLSGTGKKRTITLVDDVYTLSDTQGNTRIYDTTGKITEERDRNSNSISYTYTGTLLTKVADSFGNQLTLSYQDGRINTLSMPTGDFIYSYDDNDNLVSVMKPDSSVVQYLYTDPGDPHNLTGVVNEEGAQIENISYDDQDRVVKASLSGGEKEVTIEYLPSLVRKITNSKGVETTYQLSLGGGIARIGSYSGPGCSTCGSSADTSYLYDDRLRVLQSTDGKGVNTSYTYDDNGNKLTKTVAVGTPLEKTTTYTYTTENWLETSSEESIANPGQSYTTTNSYDSYGNLLTKSEAGFAGSQSITKTVSYTYNSQGQITTIDGPRTDVNDVTTLSYYPTASGNNSGQLHTITNALGHTTTYSDYNVHGQPETITDANGQISSRTYDSRGRLVNTTVGDLHTSYTYNKAGELLNIIHPDVGLVSYSYDSAGRIEKITDSLGNSIVYSYDTEGRKTGEQIEDPAGTLQLFSNFEYDDSGRQTKVLLPGNAEQSAGYDEVGNLVQTINATGLQTEMDYDALNRLESVLKGTNSTGYMYDAAGNLTQVTDAKGNTTTYGYDDFSQRLMRTSPESGVTSYSYDEAGNLASITDGLNRVVDFEYDALNRPTRQYFGGKDIFFLYDQGTNAIGRLNQVDDEYGSSSFFYDEHGRLEHERRTINTNLYTVGYGYSATTGDFEQLTYPSGMVVKYGRDAAGQINSVALHNTPIISNIAHAPFGPIISADMGTTNLLKTLDKRYNIATISMGDKTFEYDRDAEGQVETVRGIFLPSVATSTTSYEYTPGTNRLEIAGGKELQYDAVGNLISAQGAVLNYDELNRLTSIDYNGSVLVSYGYDASNRRIIKTIGSTTTHYLYDSSSNLIAEARGDGTILKEYIYLDGQIVAMQDYLDTPGLYYYMNDHLGTPQVLVDSNGVIVWSAAYLPFGQAQVKVATVENNIRFPGQYYDSETGLHYNWHRFYDPQTGRYISADPIGLRGGMNLYAYANQNPTNNVDPEGLRFFLPRGFPGLEKEYKAWENIGKNFAAKAESTSECLTCVARCSLGVVVVSKAQEIGITTYIKAVALGLSKEGIKKAIPVYNVYSAVSTAYGVADCYLTCKK